MNKSGTGLCLLLLLLSLLGSRPAPAAGNEETLELTRAIIQADRREFIAGTLNLTPAEAEIFWPLYEAYAGEAGLVKERQAQLVDDYVRSYEQLTNEMALQIMDRWLDLEQKSLNIRRAWVKRFNKDLPATTVARFFQLEHRMDVVIKAELAQVIPALR
jgi:hypothetical protein